jgi:ribonuclease HI
MDTDFGSSILQLADLPQPYLEIRKPSPIACETIEQGSKIWKMFFNGASSKDGVGAGVVFISPSQEVITLSFNLEFNTTNNIVQYEALVLGLRAAKDIKIEELSFFGDANLIVHKIINIYQENHLEDLHK